MKFFWFFISGYWVFQKIFCFVFSQWKSAWLSFEVSFISALCMVSSGDWSTIFVETHFQKCSLLNHLSRIKQLEENLVKIKIYRNHGRRKVYEHILFILAAQPGPNGQLSCLHCFKIFWPMKPSYISNELTWFTAHFDV